MEEAGNGGRIVNLSSIAGLGGSSAFGQQCFPSVDYGVSKHAIAGMTKILALG